MNPADILHNLPRLADMAKKDARKTLSILQRMRSGEAEQLITDIHDQVFQELDCLECGNCCSSLGPRIIQRDVTRLAKNEGLSSSEFTRRYLKKDEDGDLVFKQMPCPFLGVDNYCAVYSQKPKACSDYPHTNGRQVRGHMGDLLKNMSICPAVYEIMRRLGMSDRIRK